MKAVKRIASARELRGFQRLMHAAVTRPLGRGDRIQSRWRDGRRTAKLADGFIRGSGRLPAVARLEIYNRMYWFRIIDCFYDDNPGLAAALGPARFDRLARAYLAKHPSRSYTLRNLCRQLEKFIVAEPKRTAPRTRLARDLARLEWAQTQAFDAAALPPLRPQDFAGKNPAALKLTLQPHVTLLALDYPVDEYVLAVKQRESLRGEASNARVVEMSAATKRKKVALPKPQRAHLAVHRSDNRVFYKRLEPAAFQVLHALSRGRSLGQAIARAGRGVTPEQVQGWFATWMELGWFARTPARRASFSFSP